VGASTRTGIYVAMSRGWLGNYAWIPDATGRADPIELVEGVNPAHEDTDMATATERSPLMDLRTVAEYLAFTERHIRRGEERRIPFIRCGHSLRLDPDEIDRWLDTKRVPCRSRAS